MPLKRFSTVCCAVVMSIGAIGLCSFPVQAATQKENFFISYVVVLKKAPHLPGDEDALVQFALMNDKQKDDLYIWGTIACYGLKSGKSIEQVLAAIKNNYPAEKNDVTWSTQVATVNAAKASICPQ
jgi:Protein of unknown function (DUF732)